MKIDLAWLEKEGACEAGIEAFRERTSGSVSHKALLGMLLAGGKRDWALWVAFLLPKQIPVVRLRLWALACAGRSLKHYEAKYADDKRP